MSAPARSAASRARAREWPVVLLGEVDLIRDQRFHLEERGAQRTESVRECATELTERGAVHRRRAGVDEVGNRLRLKQVDFSMQYRALRELPWPGGSRARPHERGEQRTTHIRPAVHRELHHLLPRIRAGRDLRRHHRLIERRVGVVGLMKPHTCCAAGRESGWDADARRNQVRVGPAQPNDGQRGAAGCRRDRGDRVAAEISGACARSHSR